MLSPGKRAKQRPFEQLPVSHVLRPPSRVPLPLCRLHEITLAVEIARSRISATVHAMRCQLLVRAVGVEPTRGCPQRIFLPATAFAAAHAKRGRLGSGLSLRLSGQALGAARLVSTPSRGGEPLGAWLGIASEGFPEFEQFYVAGFPARTQVWFKSVASTNSATPARRVLVIARARRSFKSHMSSIRN
jgi:hypothetical protein